LAIGCLAPQQAIFYVACQGEFRLPPIKVSNAENTRMWGSLFFGFFLLAKQKKETRQAGETDKTI